MIKSQVISSNITSSLGSTADEVFANVEGGESGLSWCSFPSLYDGMVGVMDDKVLDSLFAAKGAQNQQYTRFEKLAIISIDDAAKRCQIDLSSDRVLFILSTTKGNVELLEQDNSLTDRVMLWKTADRVAQFFENRVQSIVVSNACISGVSAIIMADRYLKDSLFDYAVVVGCDVVSSFVVAGFASFKALSEQRCRPFDQDRSGLNLGEAAATIILQSTENEAIGENKIYIDSSGITNDATHISAPSRTGQGLFDAIGCCDTSDIDFVQVHGTATPYNDQMEAIALNRAQLDKVPALSLKWHFGHTLGAAGVVETVIGIKMLENDLLLPSEGCQNQDENCKILLSAKKENVPLKAFLKTISGFGGCNAALVVRKKV